MTTIIWCDDTKTMYADTQITSNGIRRKGRKIFRHKDKILGISGDMVLGAHLIEWYTSGADKEKYPGSPDTNMYVASKDGLAYYHVYSTPERILDFPAAIGSGAEIALMAMRCGLSALDAIKKASEMDVFTGSTVESLSLVGG